mmetsp:Transcript_8778/g.25532  ORF Transcript_8778/g.25532 Transcript_8778/m.25532 type:complete len:230 (+) Transcript_8778:133-822(+)
MMTSFRSVMQLLKYGAVKELGLLFLPRCAVPRLAFIAVCALRRERVRCRGTHDAPERFRLEHAPHRVHVLGVIVQLGHALLSRRQSGLCKIPGQITMHSVLLPASRSGRRHPSKQGIQVHGLLLAPARPGTRTRGVIGVRGHRHRCCCNMWCLVYKRCFTRRPLWPEDESRGREGIDWRQVRTLQVSPHLSGLSALLHLRVVRARRRHHVSGDSALARTLWLFTAPSTS